MRSADVRRLSLSTVAATALACGVGLMAAGQALAAGAVAATCTTLQGALDTATDGDVITLSNVGGVPCNGSYTLSGKPPPFAFTIQGAGSGAAFNGAGLVGRIMTGDVTGPNRLNLTLRNLTFRNGSVAGDGGALELGGNVGLTLDSDRFLGNEATGSNAAGGAVAIKSTNGTTPIVISNSTFGDGTAAGANTAPTGGAVYLSSQSLGPSASVTGNTFAGNSATANGGGLDLEVTSPATTVAVAGNTFTGNVAGNHGGGANIVGNDLTFQGNTFTGNRVNSDSGSDPQGAGANLLGMGSPTATQSGNRFDGNSVTGTVPSSDDYGGAGERIQNYDLTSTNDRFTNNSLPAESGIGHAEGAGLAIEGCDGSGSQPARVSNLVAAGNSIGSAGRGAGLYAGCTTGGPVDLMVLDSTISGNLTTAGVGATAGLFGGPDDTLTMRNSIVAGNIGGADLTGFGTPTVTSSDACAPGPFPGAGNICASPFLANPGPGHGNAHETQFSPTVDHGTAADVAPGLATDFEGDVRIAGPTVDMGADEFTQPSVVTGSAFRVKLAGATLEGTVNPNTHATSYRFEYGPSTDYGKSTTARSLAAGSSLVPVSRVVTGLKPGRAYHFRIRASNSAGTSFGLDHTFRAVADKWPGASIATQTVTVDKGVAAILVGCPGGPTGTCTGKLSLGTTGKVTLRPAANKGRKLALGTKKFSIKAGRAKRVKVRISTDGRRALSRHRTIATRAIAVGVDALGTKRTTSGKVTLRRRH
jgi:hypothetical protein